MIFKIFPLLLLCVTFLLAQNPKPFAALGDSIYNNAPIIKQLEHTSVFSGFESKIQAYLLEVQRAKELGFALQKGVKGADKMQYLKLLRKLSRDNDMFVRMIHREYEKALQTGDSKLFKLILDSGIIDVKMYKKEILEYYFSHKNDFPTPDGLLKAVLLEDEKLRVKEAAKLRRKKSKKERELEKIKRIREKDRREREALEKRLQEELLEQKKELREEQKKELSKTI